MTKKSPSPVIGKRLVILKNNRLVKCVILRFFSWPAARGSGFVDVSLDAFVADDEIVITIDQ